MNRFNRLPIITPFLLPSLCSANNNVAPLAEILSQQHDCSETITIRSQALTPDQITLACTLLQNRKLNSTSYLAQR